MTARSEKSDFRLIAKVLRPMRKADFLLELQAHTENGKLRSDILWSEQQHHKFYGSLSSETLIETLNLQRIKESRLKVNLLPTALTINDTIWNIEPGSIMFNDGQLNIQNLSLSHAQQRLSVSGEYAQHRDGLLVNLRQFDVGYALSMIGLEDSSSVDVPQDKPPFVLLHKTSCKSLRISTFLISPSTTRLSDTRRLKADFVEETKRYFSKPT